MNRNNKRISPKRHRDFAEVIESCCSSQLQVKVPNSRDKILPLQNS